MNFNSDAKPNWEPIGDPSVPSGYSAPARIQSNRSDGNLKENFNELSKVAAEIMGDPLQMRMLADRVYELMLEDLRHQKERSRNYGELF